MKNTKTSFTRSPVFEAQYSEKPFTTWSSGKIKRIYDSYEVFCQEIGKLLDGPSTAIKTSKTETEDMIEEFEYFWQQNTPYENAKQLMTVLSPFYKAGLILKSDQDQTRIHGFFADTSTVLADLIEKKYERITPVLSANQDLKPLALESLSIIKTLGLQGLDWKEDCLAFHFWLDPESELSLMLLSETPEPRRRHLILKTQALIQRRFYD